MHFLFTAPVILVFLFVINVMTSPGEWWVQWPALGLGIAWVINLMKVLAPWWSLAASRGWLPT